jgi:methionyl-tRNA formyltransferase
MDSLRIVFFGTPEFAVPSLQELIVRTEDITAVVTQPDRPVGRGQQVKPSPVKELALTHHLPVLQPERVRRPEFLENFRSLKPDLAVVVAFGQIFPKALLDIPPHGFINVHSSLLPAYRGAAPINRAIINGEAETGITIMQLDEGMDTGAILLQAPAPILPQDTAATLHDRLAVLGAQLLGKALDRLREGAWEPAAQDEATATYAAMMKKEDGCLDWTRDAGSLVNQVRGMTPWPGCYTWLDDKMLKIHRAEALETSHRAQPGTVVAAEPGGIEVAAGRGSVLLKEVQLEGKKRMPAGDFLKGYRLAAGMSFAGGLRS